MQLLGSIIAAIAIIAVTIAVVTSQLGPYRRGRRRRRRSSDRRSRSRTQRRQQAVIRREDPSMRTSACSAGAWTGTPARRSPPSAGTRRRSPSSPARGRRPRARRPGSPRPRRRRRPRRPASRADPRALEDDRAHPDQRAVVDHAALEHRHVADGDVRADDVGRSSAQWMTQLSWTLEPSPMTIALLSPRRTAPNQIEAPARHGHVADQDRGRRDVRVLRDLRRLAV